MQTIHFLRQNMRLKLQQWHIMKYALFLQFAHRAYLNWKWSNSMLIKTRSPNERIFFSHPPRPVKKIRKCTHVVSLWNNPIRLLDIAHKYKAWHLCYLSQWGLCVIFSVSHYILLEMALLSEHLQTDGFESFWYRNFEFLMIVFTMGLSGFVQTNKGSYTLCQHVLNSFKFLTKFHHLLSK